MNNTKNPVLTEKVRYFFSIREVPLFLAIILATAALSIKNPNFLIFGNIHSILLGASFEAIMAIAMSLLLILGGLDLSIGAIAGFTGVISGLILDAHMGVFAAVAGGLLAAVVVGAINGVLVAKLKVPPMIATLAMQNIVRGLIYFLTKGVGKPNFPEEYNVLGRVLVFGKIQSPIIISLLLMVVFGVLFAKSAWFRQFYFIGGNEEAAKLSGIKVDRLRIFGYTFMGLMSGIAGVLLAARMGGAIPTQGQNMEMNVIAACVIGGCSVNGGEGTIFGSFLGVLVMALITNAFNLLGVDVYWQKTILGLILLLAVLVDLMRKRKLEQ